MVRIKRLLAGAESIATFAIQYSSAPHPERPQGHGRVARYAWGRDYHTVLREKLKHLISLVEEKIGQKVAHRVFSDSVPLLERQVAFQGGLGFIGKNTLLIKSGQGSYFFIAEIIWDVKVTDFAPILEQGHCGTCSRCINNCPTDAIIEDRFVDARKCISYLTIEKRGLLSHKERQDVGDWIFGCDICQDVCPFNHRAEKESPLIHKTLPEFMASEGVGPLLKLDEVLTIRSDEDYRRIFKGTALLRTKREGLLRNALCVATNTGCVELVPLLEDVAKHDSSAIIRATALWGVCTLSKTIGTIAINRALQLSDLLRTDAAELVQTEAKHSYETLL